MAKEILPANVLREKRAEIDRQINIIAEMVEKNLNSENESFTTNMDLEPYVLDRLRCLGYQVSTNTNGFGQDYYIISWESE